MNERLWSPQMRKWARDAHRHGMGIELMRSRQPVFESGGPAVSLSITNATATNITDTTATVSVTVNNFVGIGSVYLVLTTNSATPTSAEIIAGQDASGSAAFFSTSTPITGVGVYSYNLTGLNPASISYYAFLVQYNVYKTSNIASTNFTTIPVLATGSTGLWYADSLITSPVPYIPNSAKTSTIQNLVPAQRRQFADASNLYNSTNLTVTDSNAVAPDLSNDASTITFGGGTFWFLQPGGGGGNFLTLTGTYTVGLWVKWLGTGSANFKLGEFNSAQMTLYTATGSWQRFSTTTVFASPTLCRFMMLTPDSTSAANFAIIDFDVFAGASDLGTQPQDGHQYLIDAAGLPTSAGVSGNLIDFSNGSFWGIGQFPITSYSSGITAIAIAELIATGGNGGFQVIASNLPSPQTTAWQQFAFGSAYSSSNGGPGMWVGTTKLAQTLAGNGASDTNGQQSPNLYDQVGQGLSAMTFTYDGSTIAENWINDVKLMSAPASSSPATFGDIAFGGLFLSGFFSGYKVYSIAVWPRKLSDQEVAESVAYLRNKAATAGLTTIQSTQRTYFVIGDSISEGVNGNYGAPGYAFLASASVAKKVKGADWGVGGSTATSTMFASNISPLIPAALAGGRTCIVSVFYGANDLANAASATPFLNNLSALLDSVRATGAKVIAHTVLPRTDANPINETVRNAANTTIRSWGTRHYDALADFASDPTMGVGGASNNPTYYNSQLHPTSAGHALLAPYEQTAMDSL